MFLSLWKIPLPPLPPPIKIRMLIQIHQPGLRREFATDFRLSLARFPLRSDRQTLFFPHCQKLSVLFYGME